MPAAPPPAHAFVGVLRDVPGQRVVLRTRLGDVDCVTRILQFERVSRHQENLIRQIALHGRGSLTGVPESIALTLEGYRVAARMEETARIGADGTPLWPRAQAAGLTADGYVYVTTSWIPGVPLHEAQASLGAEARERIVLDVLGILARLHGAQIAWGDLKPENIIVTPDGSAALIDLDTLREVPDDHTAAVTRDLTRTWAAPEQVLERQTYLASDLWAWAALVHRLWPGAPPADWRPLLAACQHPEPLRRPHTVELLAGVTRPGEAPLRDWLGRPLTAPDAAAAGAGGTDATERVPESVVVAEIDPSDPPRPAAQTERVAEAPVAARRSSPALGCLHLAFWAIAATTLGCLGVGAWQMWDGAAAADARADALLGALRDYKTRPEMNRKDQRPALAAMAEPTFFQYNTPRWSALAGLARVWAAGWQDTSHTWSATDEELANGVRTDLGANDRPEAALARGSALAALCRLRKPDITTGGLCAGVIDELTQFQARLPAGVEQDWMRVEGAWVEVLVRSSRADTMAAAHLADDDVHAERLAGLARCDSAVPWLPRAPVTGPELLQDCLVLAAQEADFDRYGRYATQLMGMDPAPLDAGTIRHLYSAAGPACVTVSAEKRRGEWTVKGDVWCQAVGLYARGCVDASWDVIARNHDAAPDHPWASLEQALSALPSSNTCAK